MGTFIRATVGIAAVLCVLAVLVLLLKLLAIAAVLAAAALGAAWAVRSLQGGLRRVPGTNRRTGVTALTAGR